MWYVLSFTRPARYRILRESSRGNLNSPGPTVEDDTNSGHLWSLLVPRHCVPQRHRLLWQDRTDVFAFKTPSANAVHKTCSNLQAPSIHSLSDYRPWHPVGRQVNICSTFLPLLHHVYGAIETLIEVPLLWARARLCKYADVCLTMEICRQRVTEEPQRFSVQ